MTTVTFKGKIRTRHYADGAFAYQYITVPSINSSHYDKQDFFEHPKLAAIANSDLMKPAINKMVKTKLFPNLITTKELRLDRIPDGVNVDASGFLATVTVDL